MRWARGLALVTTGAARHLTASDVKVMSGDVEGLCRAMTQLKLLEEACDVWEDAMQTEAAHRYHNTDFFYSGTWLWNKKCAAPNVTKPRNLLQSHKQTAFYSRRQTALAPNRLAISQAGQWMLHQEGAGLPYPCMIYCDYHGGEVDAAS